MAEVASADQLAAAAGNASVACIKLAPGRYALDTTLEIDRAVAIVAEQGRASLDGRFAVQLLALGSLADAALVNLALLNGRPGIVNDGGSLSLEDCFFSGCFAKASEASDGDGAALYSSGTVNMTNCELVGNRAEVSFAACLAPVPHAPPNAG